MPEDKDTTRPQEPSIPGNLPDKSHETKPEETVHNAEVMKYGADSK